MSIKLGNTVLKHGIMLAPMAGVSDRSFRILCHSMGAEYSVTEMVSAKALCYEQLSKRREASVMGTAPLAAISAEEGPVAVQIFGSEPEFMAEAAKMLQDMSYKGCLSKTAPVAIDINMGCPVRKITSNGEGSALMRDPKLAGEICYAVSRAVDIPVTVKIRAGWDKDSINAPEMAKILEASGASLICVHARTKEQLYSPGINLGVIEAVKKAVKIPVVGNGDVYSYEDAREMLDKTGCDGVMVARGAMGNPWIFSDIVCGLEGKPLEGRGTPEEICKTALSHLDAMIEHKGERVGLAEGKKHMGWYLSGIRGAASARSRIMNAKSRDEVAEVFSELFAEQ